MQLKLRVVSDCGIDDVLVTADPRTTVGELAVVLFSRADHSTASAGELGLVIDCESAERRAVAPATPARPIRPPFWMRRRAEHVTIGIGVDPGRRRAACPRGPGRTEDRARARWP